MKAESCLLACFSQEANQKDAFMLMMNSLDTLHRGLSAHSTLLESSLVKAGWSLRTSSRYRRPHRKERASPPNSCVTAVSPQLGDGTMESFHLPPPGPPFYTVLRFEPWASHMPSHNLSSSMCSNISRLCAAGEAGKD